MNNLNKSIVLGIAILVIACMPASSIRISIAGGDGNDAQTVDMKFDTLKDTAVQGFATIDGAKIQPSVKIEGKVKSFEQTHQVTDGSGKHAEVYANVVNGEDISYASHMFPKEGTSKKVSDWVLAEEWLNVGSADYIKASAMASFGPLSSGASTEVTSGSLSGYHNRAYTDGNIVQASQFGPEGEDPVYQALGEKIVVSNFGRDNRALYRLTTTATQDETTPAQFIGRTEGANGITTQYINKVEGDTVAIEDLRSKPGDNQKVTLTRHGSFEGIVTSQNSGRIIGDMLKHANAGDLLSIGAGLYKERIVLDKDLSIQGEGRDATIIDGNFYSDDTDWEKGSVFTINPGVNAHISDMTIQGGYGDYYQLFGDNYIYQCGGGVFNLGNAVIEDCFLTGNTAEYGGAICNGGIIDVINSDIYSNKASTAGGGIYQFNYDAVTTLDDSTVHNNEAGSTCGGIYYDGTIEVKGSSDVSNNHLSDGTPSDWYP